jgi:hypothetical protein
MRHLTAFLFATTACIAGASLAHAAEVQVLTSTDPALKLGSATYPGGKTVSFSVGIGSGAFRDPREPRDIIWTVGDRGPNIACSDAGAMMGPETKPMCDKVRAGRFYPVPTYSPSIYQIELDRAGGTFKVLQTIPLKTRSGKPVTGLLNPQTVASKDTGLDLAGNVLPDSADNIDLEAIVRVSDGTFWVADEMGPALAHVSADGRILKRMVPANAAQDYASADAEIVATLPAILSMRQGNRGFESIAISPDERFLYAIMQNPLANPNAAAFRDAKNARLFKIDRTSLTIVGQYIYQLDDPESFLLDPSKRQSDPRISEMVALGQDRLLVLERTEKTTKLHEIVLEGASNILGTPFDDVKTSPSLEAQNDLGKLSLTPVKKTLRFDTARDAKNAPGKIESVAFLNDGAMVLINDDDFGIDGASTQVLIVKGAVNPDKAVFTK